jgi:hypothetical protein
VAERSIVFFVLRIETRSADVDINLHWDCPLCRGKLL